MTARESVISGEWWLPGKHTWKRTKRTSRRTFLSTRFVHGERTRRESTTDGELGLGVRSRARKNRERGNASGREREEREGRARCSLSSSRLGSRRGSASRGAAMASDRAAWGRYREGRETTGNFSEQAHGHSFFFYFCPFPFCIFWFYLITAVKYLNEVPNQLQIL